MLEPNPLPEVVPVEELIRRLVAEPLWHMSRGSKELFHSDVLAWIARAFRAEMHEALSPWLTDAPGAAPEPTLREKSHLDLIFRFADRAPLAVENKAFSIPDEEQLIEYTEHALPAGGTRSRSLLLSLMDPGWVDGTFEPPLCTWTWVSYGKLATRLRGAFADRPASYEYETVRHYITLIELLQGIVASVDIREANEPLLPAGGLDQALRDDRLWELAAKVRVQREKLWIRRALDDTGLADVVVSAGFTNGTPLLDAFVTSAQGADFGWQYQSGQWRLAMRQKLDGQGRDEAARGRRVELARDHLDWFDFSLFSSLIGTSPDAPPRSNEAQGGGFNLYDPDFIYRYRLLPDATAQQLIDLAVVYTTRAVEFAGA